MMDVTLTIHELRFAMYAGVDRYCRNRHAGRTGLWQQHHNDFTSDLWGSIGELVIAKATGTYWHGDQGIPDRGAPDVGPWHVRTTWRTNGRLILHPEDRDDEPYVLVAPRNLPTLTIPGWCYGHEGKHPDHWTDPGTGRPAYFVPATTLKPL